MWHPAMGRSNHYIAQNHCTRQHPHPQSTDMPFKLDEGFSEDIRSQEDESGGTISGTNAFQQWVMAQNEDARAEIAYEVLRTLRTSTIAAVVERLTPLLHMDPVEKLPPEITSEIFAYLPASSLLTASLASQTWRERILDSRLWKTLYSGQGWGMDTKEIRAFEEAHANVLRHEFRKTKSHLRSSDTDFGQPQLKRRATGRNNDHPRRFSTDKPHWREQHGQIEADTDSPSDTVDQEMQDAPAPTQYQFSPSRRNKRQSQDSYDDMSVTSTSAQVSGSDETLQTVSLHPPLRPTLLSEDVSAADRINWAYLYKQRRRLEENWSKGRFTNFQLPHPQHLHEAHTECVYTIQFFGRWLVSGSRDKTLRVWDLDTRRLRGKPLVGHTQSVLCLQFDPTEEEDVIISGSSDTSVIVWKFSTGQKMHEIAQAHTESVLNLRFDSRYLVTCSKDKLIKVWNRRHLNPLDPDYPRVSSKSEAKIPSHIIDLSAIAPSQLEAEMAIRQIKVLQPYTLLMVLDGHGAAVNAIQIDKNQIVSASGDRNIKIWSTTNGKLIRTLPGHQKGIACVQFDSKRIVSGSSDNTVRIYDPSTGAEVAVLLGHANLVRTVQAGFGDIPGSEEELEVLARQAERDFIESVRSGKIKEEFSLRSSRLARESGVGSSLRSFGASLPPGGGGSQWGRIVSGSYDETIIIWKKDSNGRWVVGQTLRQEAAVRAAAEAELRASQTAASNTSSTRPIAGTGLTATSRAANGSTNPTTQPTLGTSLAGLQSSIQNGMNLGRQSLAGPQGPQSAPANPSSSNSQPQSYHQAATGYLAPGAQQAMHQLSAHAQNVMHAAATVSNSRQRPRNHPQPQSQPQSGGPSSVAQGPSQSQSHASQQQQPSPLVSTQPNAPSAPAPIPAPAPVPAPAVPSFLQNHPPQALHHPPGAPPNQLSRVFKLQFDARRIVCCSQDSRIIGWDFGNGDKDIVEASRFFLGP